MASFGPLYSELCYVCDTRRSFPFWERIPIELETFLGYNPYAICAACRESRSQRAFHRLYFDDFPNDVSEGVWIFLFAKPQQVARKEFHKQMCRAEPKLHLTYYSSGAKVTFRDPDLIEVDLIDHIFGYIGF